MEQLNGIDRAYLGLESGDVTADFLNLMILDPSTAPDRHDFERVRAEALARVPLVESMTRRLVAAPLAGAPEQWVTDPDFDLDRHLDRLAVPSPGDLAALQRLALEVCSAPLRRDRPLWHMWYVEGLADGRAALLLKMHHAAFDGMGAVEALGALLDPEPRPVDPGLEPAEVDGDRVPSGPELLLRTLPGQAMAPLRAARGLATLAGSQLTALGASVFGSGDDDTGTGDDDGSSDAEWAGPAPEALFNRGTDSIDRSLALTTVPLDEVKEVARAGGVTVNDVVLTLVAGALRDYLLGRGELPEQPLRAACPVNVRTDEDSSGGNAFTTMLVPLPTHLDDPAARLRYVGEATAARKPSTGDGSGTSPARTVLELVDLVPSAMFAVMGALAASGALTALPAAANLIVSNVRGPDVPMYLAGAKVEHLHGRTMAGPGLGMMIHCAGYAGQLDFGVTALAGLVGDPELITDGLHAQLAQLR